MSKFEKEKDIRNQEIAALKQEMQEMKKTYELRCLQLEAEAKEAKIALEEIFRDLEHPSRADSMCSVAETALEERIKELEYRPKEIGQHQEESCSKVEIVLEEKIEENDDLSSKVKLAELEQKWADSIKAKTDLEERIKQFGYQQADSSSKDKEVLEERIKELEGQLADSRESRNKIKLGLEEKIKDLERQLIDSRNKMKEQEQYLESKSRLWIKKENIYRNCVDNQFGTLKVIHLLHFYCIEVNVLSIHLILLINGALGVVYCTFIFKFTATIILLSFYIC